MEQIWPLAPLIRLLHTWTQQQTEVRNTRKCVPCWREATLSGTIHTEHFCLWYWTLH